ncbi:hypothetical protein BHE90_002706 [Fusarium euwallaceae]|uniref:Heterokaryon incompatibility domain-containing protein n=1 Tax=Fusarium euwallaceae TaxID=1147111 RepID=A0A430M458_9HYPO|nr:hypothetical protein BHE90_002706 [Fusarium euwallaceae]
MYMCQRLNRGLMTTSDNAASKIIPCRPINVDPASKRSFDLAREWLQTCIADHAQCPKPSLNFMPKRVICISQNLTGFSLRLVETEGLRGLYCALSYCWGGDQKTKAMKNTLAQLKTDIDFNKLPATLQDAITTTHGLGLRYLFVDSLCILQDDEKDMHIQISQMSEIYSEAAITILASRAKAVDFSFPHKRESSIPIDHSSSLFKMPLRCPDGEVGSVVVLGNGHMENRVSGPLRSRAWAFQENLMSARTLNYEDEHTIWRCSTIKDLNDGWLRTSKFLHYASFESVPKILRPRSAIKATEETEHSDERPELFWQWHGLVKEYSRLGLSFPSDKLPAISAIATRIGSALGDEYHAGIWKSRFPHDLLWESGLTQHPRPKEFRAPSWSWAAIDGDLSQIDASREPFSLEVLECHPELESPAAPYGAVTGGHLVVRGRLRRAILSGIKRRVDTFFEESEPTMFTLPKIFHIVEPGWEGVEALIPMNFDAVEQEFEDKTNMDIAMLEVCGHRPLSCHGLILREVGPQKFSRLGLFGYRCGIIAHYSRDSSDADGWLEGGGWTSSYENWLQGFDGCDLTTFTFV